MNRRVGPIKSVLWVVVGLWFAAAVARFAYGLGATTGMNAATPWGIWVGFDVLCGVALAAGGFIMLGTLHILGLERFRPLVRPAALTAFLGYLAVVVGLLHDLGLPWRIYHPLIYWQPRSVMFAVAICETIYLAVLALEFTPVVLEHRLFGGPRCRRVMTWLKRITLPLIIVGLILATLHQSLLGSLYLLTPHRLHALWYSPMIPALFLVSAIGLGLMTVVMETLVSGWLFKHRIRLDLLTALGRCAAVVLLIYTVLRLLDLAARDAFAQAEGVGYGMLFAVELVVGAALPAVLLIVPRIRASRAGLAVTAAMVIAGTVLNRLNVSLIAFSRPADLPYVPSWIEVTTTLGLLSGAALIFLFCGERLRIFEGHTHDGEPPLADNPEQQPLPAVRQYSLAFCVGILVALVFLPGSGVRGATPRATPVHPPLEGLARIPGVQDRQDKLTRPNYGVTLVEGARRTGQPGVHPVLILDGNRANRRTLFTHTLHQKRNADGMGCGTCHHTGLKPDDKHLACRRCHADMYEPADTFDHDVHVTAQGGAEGCVTCHPEGSRKDRASARACDDCHAEWKAPKTRVKSTPAAIPGIATSYRRAMHTLCIKCHEDARLRHPKRLGKAFRRCQACH